jgi:hypothetical protein
MTEQQVTGQRVDGKLEEFRIADVENFGARYALKRCFPVHNVAGALTADQDEVTRCQCLCVVMVEV